jgi:hypothetical protein
MDAAGNDTEALCDYVGLNLEAFGLPIFLTTKTLVKPTSVRLSALRPPIEIGVCRDRLTAVVGVAAANAQCEFRHRSISGLR